jgi:GNAT superfamily N-acetyltransferase
MEFSVEKWSDVLPEMKGLFELHYREIASFQDRIKLDPDFDVYFALEATGKLHVVTARDDGQLIGYHLSVVTPHMHYKNTLCAHMDVLFLLPEYRHGMAGVKLLKYAEKSLIERGVPWLINGTKKVHDFGPILERLGYKVREVIYEKFVEEVAHAPISQV